MTNRRRMEAGELRRLRRKYVEGVPLEEIAQTHHVTRATIDIFCADLVRPVKDPPQKRQAAHVPRGLI